MGNADAPARDTQSDCYPEKSRSAADDLSV
jgi:hypothetical protein